MDKHVVFVHGLRHGNAQVWTSSGKPSEVWPLWLEADIEKLGVWSAEHESAPTFWRGYSMPLVDRANNILALLLSEERLRHGNISFVAHSFGGLIFEQMLRTASDRSPTEQKVADLVGRICRVTFLGTPHLGADLATWAGRLRLLARPSFATKGLARNDSNLRALNQWYRRFAPQNGIETQTLFETRSTRFGLVVKPDSADPGLPSDPIPIDADHFGIASPASKESEVYRHVRDFLGTPVATDRRRIVVAVATLGAIARDTGQNSAALEQIMQQLSMTVSFDPARLVIPNYLVDTEVEKRILRLRRVRFFAGSDHIEHTSRLARELMQGELAASSPGVKAKALGWCARLLLTLPDREETLKILEAARDFPRVEELTIAQAFVDSYQGNTSTALGKLAKLDSITARTAAFIIATTNKSASESLEWLRIAALTVSDVDSDGKFFIIKKQLDAGKFSDALECANLLQPSDFEQTPILLYIAGGAHLAQALPEELIASTLWHLPFDAAPIPLADDAVSLAERRKARDLYQRASAAAASLGCVRASHEASDRALWLALRDPVAATDAKAELERSMRDPTHSLRRLSLAIQFGMTLDLQEVEKEIDRQDTLSGGDSPDAALARFSLALTKKSPREAAEHIAKHRDQLFRHLNPSFVKSVEIQMLAQSGQIELAEARAQELAVPNESEQERDRLKRIVSEAKGADATGARERHFKATDALTDLANLVEILELQKDWIRLVTYGRKYFERTRDLAGCRTYAQALFETGDYAGAVKLLGGQSDLVARSANLESLLAWSLYRAGDVNECRKVLAELRGKRDAENDRALVVSLAIVSGDWTSLMSFVEQEWEQRCERDAKDLLSAAQLAHRLSSPRAKDLIFEAASKADGNPEVLTGCYSTAVSAGWEDEVTSAWLGSAAALSGKDGPVKQVSMKELLEMHPGWQKRESETWDRLDAGELPIFAAGDLLNRSLIELYLLPALLNRELVDPRRRSLIFAFSGARNFVRGVFRSASLDPTVLLTAGMLGTIGSLLSSFERIVIPHSTLGWLFDEKERIQFQQPSRLANAKEIKRLLDANILQRFESTVRADNELAAEVGDELAALFVEAESSFDQDHPRRFVVRSAPIHRVSSLLEEEASLGHHIDYVCGCLDVVDALARQGQLTRAEEDRARAFLVLRERPWPSSRTLEAGAVLYLDELSISYLQHLSLLPKIQAAGFAAMVPTTSVSRGDNFVRYESLARRATDIIEDIRRALADGIASGKVILAPAPKLNDRKFNRLEAHPTMEVLKAADLVDVVLVDDRYFNQNGNVQCGSGTKPIWTSFDLLIAGKYDLSQQREYVTNMRRAALGFVPLHTEELEALVGQASVSDGRLVESAELKAVRESLQVAIMSNALQLPKEHIWLDNIVHSFTEVTKAQWNAETDEQLSRARSDWLLEQLDIRQWSHRFRIDGHPEIGENRYRGQVLALAMLNTGVPRSVKAKYWQWLDDALLKQIQGEHRELYDAIVQQARAAIDDAFQRSEDGDSNAG